MKLKSCIPQNIRSVCATGELPAYKAGRRSAVRSRKESLCASGTTSNPLAYRMTSGLPTSDGAGSLLARVRLRRLFMQGVAAVLATALVCVSFMGCSSLSSAESPADTRVSSEVANTSEGAVTAADISGMDFSYSDRDLDAMYVDAAATHITLAGVSATVEGAGAVVDGSTITISQEGTYVLAGYLSDGQVVVDATNDAKVQVVLDGVSIHNEDGPALCVAQADKVFVTLADGSNNVLTDGAVYALGEGEDEPNATLFSKDDLTINGAGALSVTSSYRHAINSKDDLVITGGTITVDAAEDGLRGRDCVKIGGGDIAVNAVGDAVKSSNDEDATRGFVSITGGTFDLTGGDDGVQAVTLVRVAGGNVAVTAADDALHSDIEALIADGVLAIEAGDDAVHAETLLTVDGGIVNVSGCYEGYEAERIVVNGGETHIVAQDDAINAAAAEVATTTTDVLEGDGSATNVPDGPPADSGAAGTRPPADAVRGAAPGEPSESANENRAEGGKPMMGMAEGGMGMGNSDCLIEVNGGYTVVEAAGDGIDSNGSFAMTGGVLLVCGPTDNGNGAFDYDIEATISGGTIVMVGSTGMAQNFTSGTQPFSFNTVSGSAGQSVAVADSTGKVIASFTPAKQYGMVLVSSSAMIEGESYTLTIGGTVSGANADGYTDSGSVSGGSSTVITASTTATGGMGGLGRDGAGMGAGMAGEGRRGGRNMM